MTILYYGRDKNNYTDILCGFKENCNIIICNIGNFFDNFTVYYMKVCHSHLCVRKPPILYKKIAQWLTAPITMITKWMNNIQTVREICRRKQTKYLTSTILFKYWNNILYIQEMSINKIFKIQMKACFSQFL